MNLGNLSLAVSRHFRYTEYRVYVSLCAYNTFRYVRVGRRTESHAAEEKTAPNRDGIF